MGDAWPISLFIVPFTKENAREFHAKSMLARANNKAKRLALADFWEREFTLDPDFEQLRLRRVRKQLSHVDSLVEQSRDPQAIERLVAAQFRLSEQERILSGRPLPGTLRPSEAQSRDMRLMRRAVAAPVFDPSMTPQPAPSTNGHQPPAAEQQPQPSPLAQAQAQASSATSTEAPSQGQASTQEQTQATKPEQSEGEGTEGRNS